MELAKVLPHGSENEKFGVLGLGMGGIQHTPTEEIEAIIRKAIDNGSIFLTFVQGARCMSRLAKRSRGGLWLFALCG